MYILYFNWQIRKISACVMNKFKENREKKIKKITGTVFLSILTIKELSLTNYKKIVCNLFSKFPRILIWICINVYARWRKKERKKKYRSNRKQSLMHKFHFFCWFKFTLVVHISRSNFIIVRWRHWEPDLLLIEKHVFCTILTFSIWH